MVDGGVCAMLCVVWDVALGYRDGAMRCVAHEDGAIWYVVYCFSGMGNVPFVVTCCVIRITNEISYVVCFVKPIDSFLINTFFERFYTNDFY